MSEGVKMVRGLYAALAKGDAETALGAMSPDIVWKEAENFPYADGNPYVGPEAVAEGVLARLGSEWDGFAVHVEDVLDAGDRIVALGRYTGAFKTTGKKLNAQFVHVWTLKDGKLSAFQQYTDTLQVAQATW